MSLGCGPRPQAEEYNFFNGWFYVFNVETDILSDKMIDLLPRGV
jgi:hypothetical protein